MEIQSKWWWPEGAEGTGETGKCVFKGLCTESDKRFQCATAQQAKYT